MLDEQIRRLVSEKLDVPAHDVSPSSNLESDLGADSLDVVALLMAIEREFAISIPNEHFDDLKTLGDVTGYVRARAVESVFAAVTSASSARSA